MNFEYNNIPNRLKKILKNLKKNYKIIKEIKSGIIINKPLFNKIRESIYQDYKNNELKFIKNLAYCNKFLTYDSILRNFNHFCPMEISINQISTPRKEEIFKKKNSGYCGGLQPHPIANDGEKTPSHTEQDVREIPSYDAIRKINQKKEDFGIWISTNKLDHVRTWNAKFNFKEKEEKELFYKIEVGLGVVKYNTNKWITPIKKEDGYLLSVHLCKNINNPQFQGTVRINIERGFNEDIVFQENFFRIFNFLNIIDYKYLLQLFVNEKDSNPLFYVELANPIGPKIIIDEKFKKAHLRCFMHNGAGGQSWIETHIDYSLKSPELELKGPWLPTASLRDATVEAAKFSDSVLFMHSQTKKGIRQVHRDHDIIYNQVYKTGQTLQLVGKRLDWQYDDFMGEITKSQIFNELYYTDIKSLLQLNINNTEPLFQEISLINKKIDNLSEKMVEEFHNLKDQFKNTLYLLLRNESNKHEVTIKELIKESRTPRTTLLYHLKKLQEKGYIEVGNLRNGKRGRPPKLYKIHKKIKNLIKKSKISKKNIKKE